ncbi:hypothetical protein SIN07_07270 [Pediococcus inopinatus]|uniref:Uncharacterized protein n=1 Tax=Pediococcus inopinatus TaxID=114090 RepID=A0ABZ0Q7E8_9LACO|nr:hypothetical protein [Pediococcus inopinatus]WPC17285.1 hypothetical protein N6G94_08885 [Pediococcus inopinatus]WPC22264.1 hypothetical protein N6G96_03320 [Pediococcus inopinatus]WPP08802.1 hypothetical protein SIN07_07270 [Pediococcus inopinatus]
MIEKVSQKTLVRIGEGSFQIYSKLSSNPSTTDLPGGGVKDI